MTTESVTKVGLLDRFFEISTRGSTIGKEVNGGFATFLSMSYIVVLNPIILTSAPVAGDVPPFPAVAAVTAFMAALATLAMGLIGRVPFALAAGLGINGFVAFQLAPVLGYGGAMTVVVLEGLVTFVLVLTGIRVALFNAIPVILKQAIGAGIGAFLVLIGLVDGGIVKGSPMAPSLNLEVLNTWPRLVFVLVLVAAIFMMVRKWRGAIIYAIIGGTILSVIIESVAKLGSAVDNPAGWVLNVPTLNIAAAWPDLSVFGQFNIEGALSAGPILLVFFVFSLVLADLFDTSGTIVAVGRGAGILDKDGNPPRLKQILAVDSAAAALGGFAGVSSNTTYIESAAGVRAGARTGFANVITALLFVVAGFFGFVVQVVPSEAAAPILVVVGFLMVWDFVEYVRGELKAKFTEALENVDGDAGQLNATGVVSVLRRKLQAIEESFKENALVYGFVTVATLLMMPFTYSITNGIGIGFVVYTLAMAASGKARKVHPLMWVMAVAFVVYFALPLIRGWLGV